jgi:cbb3-type cytochrome oxidase subunit 3
MRLSDVISHLGLAAFPIFGMLLFLSVFVGVVLHVTRRNRYSEFDAAARLPLADDTSSTEPRT